MVEPKFKSVERAVRRVHYQIEYFLYRLVRLFRAPEKIDKTNIKRILFIELTVIGDLLVLTPTLHACKTMFPKARIDILMYEKFKSIFGNNKDISIIIGVDNEPSVLRWREFKHILAKVQANKYDMVFIAHHGTFSNSLLCLLAQIPRRVGSMWSGMLKGKGFFLTHKLPPIDEDMHVVEQNMSLLKTIDTTTQKRPRLEFPYSKKDKEVVDSILSKNKISKQFPLIAIHPGTRHSSHKWFNDRFAHVADYLAKTHHAQIIFTGDDYDQTHFIHPIQRLMQYKSHYVKTTLTQCPALLSLCDMLLSVDTGMIHMGTAAGIPVLGLYGSGKPKTWGPWGENSRFIFNEYVPCTGCRRTYCTRDDYVCMNSITTKQVREEIDEHFSIFLKKVRKKENRKKE